MYPLYQAQEDLLARLRPFALDAAGRLRASDTGRPETLPLLQAVASLQLIESAGTTHQKPAFGLTHARVGDKLVEVREEALLATPFCTLRRFAKDVADPGRACWWSRRNPAISPPGCAAPSRPCCPNTTCM